MNFLNFKRIFHNSFINSDTFDRWLNTLLSRDKSNANTRFNLRLLFQYPRSSCSKCSTPSSNLRCVISFILMNLYKRNFNINPILFYIPTELVIFISDCIAPYEIDIEFDAVSDMLGTDAGTLTSCGKFAFNLIHV